MLETRRTGTPKSADSRATRARRPNRESREPDRIEIIGAREHNLKIDHLEVPKSSLVVFTGVSGSGKSSLAFDTLYAEGQRRYVESLSTYARQFLGRLDRPNVEKIRGLSPTIAIEQKSASSNPRSTVGTITEILDYLRVLYARAGKQHCHQCDKPVGTKSVDEIVDDVLATKAETMLVLAPVVIHRKGEFRDLFEELAARGFARARVDGTIQRLEAVPPLDKKKKHSVELVIDRVKCDPAERARIAEAVELALREGKGELLIEAAEGPPATLRFSEGRTCCGHAFPELSPQSFSFNSPLGMCTACNGLGTRVEVDPALVVPDPKLSIKDGAIAPWATAMQRGEGWTFRIIDAVAKATGADMDLPWRRLPEKQRKQVLYGLAGEKVKVTWGSEKTSSQGSWAMKYEGVIPTLMRRYRETTSEMARDQYRKFFAEMPCDTCGGRRLRVESMAVRVGKNSIADITAMSVSAATEYFEHIKLGPTAARIAEGVLREIRGRLSFLVNVGLEYLTLERSCPTLSGGEAQRIRLASQLGSELSGVMYVLDEPSIGLHARDNERLIATLERLRDLGNTVLVVEHDEETIRAADHVIDFGLGAGHLGGEVIFAGTPAELEHDRKGLTGRYLAGVLRIDVPEKRREANGEIVVRGVREHNLKGFDVSIPLGTLVAVTGVSGAGKSSLVNGIVLPALSRALHGSSDPVGAHDGIDGLDEIDKVIAIDQKPIGRTPRSNPGTYTKAFDEIREIFAQLPEARQRGYSSGRFSFNVKGGRCEACSGDGVVKVEMHFLADVYVPCEVCHSKRYNAQTLEVKFKGRNIADILGTSVDDCKALFASFPSLSRILDTLVDVGLGYIKIGQAATTMSGGEAQRVKLSRELGKRSTGRTLYILDEPTTGLHFEDTRRLLIVLQKLVDAGNTVMVIEHNLDVVKCADHVIDLGPEGGDAGGLLLAEGTPEQIAKVKKSYTGQHLARVLAPREKPAPKRTKSKSTSS